MLHDAGLPAPDFAETPALMNTDPWEGIGPIWYWSTRNLSRYADANNIEMITRRINGGLNGYADRLRMYERSALVLLGRKLEAGAVKRFQTDRGLTADDIVGPATRAALHKALVVSETEAVVAKAELVAHEPPLAQPVPVPGDWQPQLTIPEYLAIIETSTAAIRKLSAGA
ncbi:hypothetical protein VSX64_20625 [Aurantimonas sp. C2-6-R+9]|uniref:hypothetical protein n=1 Tax=unclassified Aurantimonas TaxID=2638230 RepID=UPI002E1967BF|nr:MULTISPECIES: hypothetical protein [unclassified Aurantimonas]MEC5293124.1 hypothetical protein [Aurantimonas sp. C2-3-R2]MEC5383224.1 hypothetical protein [Aurantimonas sp. C2-6-R+9]MEC5414208.1 hypothetical protein [Aurantimonas sp. C2-4-R8]